MKLPNVLRSPGGAFGIGWLSFIFVASITAPMWRPYDVAEQDLLARLQGPSSAHWLGTDPVGRDILSRVFTAGALPLLSSMVMLIVAFAIAVPAALFAAERGGKTEQFIARFAETIMSLPGTVVLLAAIGAIGNKIYPIMAIFGLLISSAVFRILLGIAKSSRQRLYVDAARVNGMGSFRINVIHVLPAMARSIAVQAALTYAIGLVIVNGLAFLGFGPSEPDPSWGFMIKDASDNIFTSAWLMIPPGLALAITVIAANTLSDSLAAPQGDSHDSGTVTKRRRAAGLALLTPSAEPINDDNLLRVHELTIAVDDGPTLVSGVSFALKPGEVLGLVGESGCGKTMTARSLLGLVPGGVSVANGSIQWQGRELVGSTESQLRALRGSEIAMISQEPMVALDPLFSVKYQLTRPIRRMRNVGRREAESIALELLDQVGIVGAADVMKSYPHQLSGGMAQRVAIALALTGEPKLLVADEPTTALDVTVQAEILSLLRELVRDTDMSIVIVSHDLGVIADICDQAAVMYAGEIVESGQVSDVLEDAQHPYTMALLGASPHVGEDEPVPHRLAAIDGTVPPPGKWPTGCRFAARCQFASAACSEPNELVTNSSAHAVRCIHADHLREQGQTWRTDALASSAGEVEA